jgi:hypothetical protein
MPIVVPLAARVRALAETLSPARDPGRRRGGGSRGGAPRRREALAAARRTTPTAPASSRCAERRRGALSAASASTSTRTAWSITCGGHRSALRRHAAARRRRRALVALSHPERIAAACVVRGVRSRARRPSGAGRSDLPRRVTPTPTSRMRGYLALAQRTSWAVVFEPADAGGRSPRRARPRPSDVTIGSLGLARGWRRGALGYLAAPPRRPDRCAIQAGAHPLHHQRVAVGRPGPGKRTRDPRRTPRPGRRETALRPHGPLQEIPGAIALGRGDPDLDAPPVIAAARARSRRSRCSRCADPWERPSCAPPSPAARKVDHGLDVGADHVLVTTGGQRASSW